MLGFFFFVIMSFISYFKNLVKTRELKILQTINSSIELQCTKLYIDLAVYKFFPEKVDDSIGFKHLLYAVPIFLYSILSINFNSNFASLRAWISMLDFKLIKLICFYGMSHTNIAELLDILYVFVTYCRERISFN